MPVDHLASRPHPCAGYADALMRLEALCARDTPEVNPLCHTTFLTHGRKTGRAIVFWHGYTNCPRQFHALAKIFFEKGYNVLIPRLPHHGLADRMTTALAKLASDELIAQSDTAIDIACGLAEQVTVAGLSAGGVLAAWAAHKRAEVDKAVLIAPGFAYTLVPAPLTRWITRVARALPNVFLWWDLGAKDKVPGPQHAYPRFSTHGLAAFNRIAFDVQDTARHSKPVARALLVVNNACDPAVDNRVTVQVVRNWQAHGAAVQLYEFPVEHKLIHDLIDPDQTSAQTGLVYSKLVELIDENGPTRA